MASETSFSAMISRLREGDEDAASEVFQRYVKRLIALASREFDAGVRSKEDPEDVANSVLKSFFVKDIRKHYKLSSWDGLWALLAQITVYKCMARREFWKAARRDVKREVRPGPDAPVDWMGALDREPTAEETTVLGEEIKRLVDRLPLAHRRMAELHIQNYPVAEIAELCGCSTKTVRRVGERIHIYLEELRRKVVNLEPRTRSNDLCGHPIERRSRMPSGTGTRRLFPGSRRPGNEVNDPESAISCRMMIRVARIY